MMNPESPNEQPTLKGLRESADLTQPQLSNQLGVGIRIVNDWEAGRKIPRFDNAIALARVLGVSLKALAKSMHFDVTNVSDEGLSLIQLKALCKERGIKQISDLPDDWTQLIRRNTTD